MQRAGRLPAQAGQWPPRGPVRVLLVLDRPVTVHLAAFTLTHGVYATRTVATAADAQAQLTAWQPHLVLLDMELESRQVLEAIGATPAGAPRVPVIGLTRGGGLASKLAAFDLGVDDVLNIPFDPEELLARVIALVRRAYSDAVTFTPVITLGELEINILHRTVHVGTAELQLTSLEQSLLYLLASNAGRVVTRTEILETLWGGDYAPESNVVDRQVRNLRLRLHDDWQHPRYIQTVPGEGYRFLATRAPRPPA